MHALTIPFVLIALATATSCHAEQVRDTRIQADSTGESTTEQELQTTRYPVQLHGFWIAAGTPCPVEAGFYDGETMMDISPEKLVGYEEVYRPTNVSLISEDPIAWSIESMIDVGPSGFFSDDEPRVFVLGSEMLTVTSSSSSDIYRKCQLKGQ